MVDFLFVIDFFRYLLRLRRYKRRSVEVDVFRRGGLLWGWILGWRVTFRVNIYGPLNRGMVILQPRCWAFSHKETLYTVADFIRLKLTFILKNEKKLLYEPPFRELRNVHTPSIARWNARGRLSIRHNWTFFRYLLRLRRYKRKSVEVGVFRRRWVILGEYFRWKGTIPSNSRCSEKTRDIIVSYVLRYWQTIIPFVTIYTHLTGG